MEIVQGILWDPFLLVHRVPDVTDLWNDLSPYIILHNKLLRSKLFISSWSGQENAFIITRVLFFHECTVHQLPVQENCLHGMFNNFITKSCSPESMLISSICIFESTCAWVSGESHSWSTIQYTKPVVIIENLCTLPVWYFWVSWLPQVQGGSLLLLSLSCRIWLGRLWWHGLQSSSLTKHTAVCNIA